MGFKEIMEKLFKKNEVEEEEIDDDVTTDKYLRSLRRQRRLQMEEIEKEQLKKKIADFNRNKIKKHLFGIKDNAKKQKQLLDALNKKREINIMKEKNLMLKNKEIAIKKVKKQKQMAFLNRGML